MSNVRGRTGPTKIDQTQPLGSAEAFSRSTFRRIPGLTEQPVLKRRPAYLLGRSPLRCFYYTKGVRGKWHTADRVTRGMRWNYYMYHGKAIPHGSIRPAPKLPPIVKGLLTSISAQKKVDHVLAPTHHAEPPAHKKKATHLAEMKPLIVRSSRSRAEQIDINVPPQDIQQLWIRQQMLSIIPFNFATVPVNDTLPRTGSKKERTATPDKIPTAFVSMEVQGTMPLRNNVSVLRPLPRTKNPKTVSVLRPLPRTKNPKTPILEDSPQPHVHIENMKVESVRVAAQQDIPLSTVAPVQVQSSHVQEPVNTIVTIDAPRPARVREGTTIKSGHSKKRPKMHRIGLAPVFSTRTPSREEIRTDAPPNSEISISTHLGFGQTADVGPQEIRLQGMSVPRHVGYIPTVRKKIRQLKVAVGAEAVPPQ